MCSVRPSAERTLYYLKSFTEKWDHVLDDWGKPYFGWKNTISRMDGWTPYPGWMEEHHILDGWMNTISRMDGWTPYPGWKDEHHIPDRQINTISQLDKWTPYSGWMDEHHIPDGWMKEEIVLFVLFVYVCPHRISTCGAHYDNSFEWIDTRNLCHKHQHAHSIPKTAV